MTYYWENPVGVKPDCGKFKAENDDKALLKMPKTAICMYRENDINDMVIIYHSICGSHELVHCDGCGKDFMNIDGCPNCGTTKYITKLRPFF
jgi:hypothetical protein